MQALETRQPSTLKFEKIVTSSDLMLPVFERVSRVAEVDTTVLIRGESGAGKELIAEAIHANSPRRHKPLVVINMAAVPKDLLESELFGHMAGAFTGSTATRTGRFEAADEGTLFIDEIGDLALEGQAKLLRVLENRCVTPVGSNQDRHIDVRVVAATNRNLEQMIRDGEFREELYYRLNVVSITLPPLRERPEDIETLVHHFLDNLSRIYEQPAPVPDGELMHYLKSYRWPGNVRQLRNCVESMFVLADSPTLTMNDLPAMIRNDRQQEVLIDIPEGLTLKQFQSAIVRQTLDRCRGNRTHAAKLLGVSVRTLQRQLNRWERVPA